jgi:hypothetical protein
MATCILVPIALLVERAWLLWIAEPVQMTVSSVTLYPQANQANPKRPVTYDFFAEYIVPSTGVRMRCTRYQLMGKDQIIGSDTARRAKFAALPGKTLSVRCRPSVHALVLWQTVAYSLC